MAVMRGYFLTRLGIDSARYDGYAYQVCGICALHAANFGPCERAMRLGHGRHSVLALLPRVDRCDIHFTNKGDIHRKHSIAGPSFPAPAGQLGPQAAQGPTR